MLGEREPDMIELIRVEKTELFFQKLNFDATVVPSNFSNCMDGHHIISNLFLPRPFPLEMPKKLRGFVDKTETRLSPGSCTVQYKQLNMCTQGVEFCSPCSRPFLLRLIAGTFKNVPENIADTVQK